VCVCVCVCVQFICVKWVLGRVDVRDNKYKMRTRTDVLKMRFTFLRDRMYASNYYNSRSSLSTLFPWTNLPRFVPFLPFRFVHWPILKHTTVSHEMVRTRHSSLYFFAQQGTFAPGSSFQDTVIHTAHAEGSCRHRGMLLVQPKTKSLSVDPQCFTRIGGWFLISCSNVSCYKLPSTTIKLTVVRRDSL
jgi:hypothetical protein